VGPPRRTLPALLHAVPYVVLAVFGALVWNEWRASTREREALEKKLEEERERNRALQRILDRMTEERVFADVVVLDQTKDADGDVVTTIRLHLRPRPGETTTPLVRGPFTIEGERMYFEALTLRFDDRYVREGDPRRGRALLLLTRVFGERQSPEQGFPIEDLSAGVPAYYRIDDPALARFERELWGKFWRFATHREEAKAEGVDVAYGQAPFTLADPRVLYEIHADNRGHLTIRART
jgi:hypothetical protein